MHFNRNRCSLLCFVNRVKYMMIYLTTPATVVVCSCDSLLGALYRWHLKSGDNFFTTFRVPVGGSWCCTWPRAQLRQEPEKQNFMNTGEESNPKKEKREFTNPLCVHGKLRSGLGFPRSCQVPNQICRECTEIPAIDGLRIYRTFTKAHTRVGL